MTARGGTNIIENGLVFLYDPLSGVSESIWYDRFSTNSASYSASSQTGSYFYLDNQSLSISSPNPNKGDYTYCLWLKPYQTNSVLFDKDRNFRLFLTSTNQIQVSIFPTDNLFGLNGIHATGSYLYTINSGGNNNFFLIRYNGSDLTMNSVRRSQNASDDEIYFVYPYDINSYDGIFLVSGYRAVTEFSGSDKFMDRNTGYRAWTKTGGVGPPDTHQNDARGCSIDADYFYITDEDNHRVVKRNRPDNSYVTHSGGTAAGSGDLQYSSPKGICIDADYVYVCDTNNHRIKKLNIADLTLDIMTGSLGNNNGQFNQPYGIDCDDTYLYIAEYAAHRMTKLNKADLTFVARTGSAAIDPSDTHYFANPTYISVDGDDLFVVSSLVLNTIKKFSAGDFSYKNVQITSSDLLQERGYWYGVKDCSLDSDGYLNCIDRNRYYRRHQPVSGNLILSGTFNNYNSNDAYAVVRSGSYFYMANTLGYDVRLFDTDWNFITESGTGAVGSGDYEYNLPYGITVSPDYVYVTDRGNNRIKKLNKSDLSLVSISSPGVTTEPYGIEYYDGILYVASRTDNQITLVDPTDLSVIDTTTATSIIYGISVDENYIYSYDFSEGNGISKRLRASPYTLLGKGLLSAGDDINQKTSLYNVRIDEEYIYIADTYGMTIIDKEYLTFVNALNRQTHNWVGKKLTYCPTGSWLNIVVTLGQTSGTLFVNGELHASHSWTGSLDAALRPEFSSDSPFTVGSYIKLEDFSRESIGMMSGYNRILSEPEIETNYKAMKSSRFNK